MRKLSFILSLVISSMKYKNKKIRFSDENIDWRRSRDASDEQKKIGEAKKMFVRQREKEN